MLFSKKPLIVQKFGGTSLASITHISQVASIIEKESHKKKLVIVVSAMAGDTNESIAKCLAINVGKNPLGQEAYDSAISSSENLSAALLTLALINKGIFAKTLQGWQIPILTDDNFSKAKIIKINHDKILHYLDKDIVPVICGFQGVTEHNAITTLGRGGSDTTAVAVAAAIKADFCEIYTDVPGVFSADPRLVPKALKIDSISYEEMLCFSFYGAKVLERRSVEIAMRYNISLKVIETNSGKSGTNVIQKQIKISMESSQIKGITLKNDIIFYQIHTRTQKDLHNVLKKFTNVSCFNVSINYNESKCTFESPLSEGSTINSIVENKELVSHYVADTQSALVVIVGWSIGENCDLLAKVWKELDKNQIKIQEMTSETHCIKIKVSLSQSDSIIKQLHKVLLEERQ